MSWKKIKDAAEKAESQCNTLADIDTMFGSLLQKYSGETMVRYVRGETFYRLGYYELALDDFSYANKHFELNQWQEKALDKANLCQNHIQ